MRVKTSHVFYLVQVVILAVVYFGVAKLGLALSFYEGVVTLVWPPTGIALAAILLFGYRLWPGLVLGAFLANISTGAPLGFAVGTAIGNPLAAVVGAYLLRRWVGFQNSLERVRDVLGLVFLGAAVGTLVSATIGVASLCLNGMATWAAYGSVWWEWWLGDAMGVLIVAPPLLTWGARPRVSGSPWRIVEAGVLLILLVMVSLSVYSGWFAQAVTVPLSYAIFPLAIWAALRFGPRGVATVTLIWTGLAVWGTARGFGPFGQVPVPVGLLYLNLTTMGSVAALLLAAIIAERARAEETTVRLASFPELNPNPIIEVDLAGRIQYLNPAARRLFPDLEPKAPYGQMAKLEHPWLAGLGSVADRFRTGGTDSILREVMIGECCYEQALYCVEDGQRIRVYGLDVTERKQEEAEREQLLAELERRNIQLQTAAGVSKSASTILDPEMLMRQAVDLIQERFGLYYVGIFLVDEAGEYAVLHAGTGEAGRQMIQAEHKLAVGGQSMIGQSITCAQARIARDVGVEAVRFDNPYLPETRSELALPLISRGQCIGALTVQSTCEAAFSEQDVAVLQTMADHLAIAIENARLYKAAQREIAERQRAEEVLQASETRYRRLFESARDGILILDADTGQITDVNPFLREMLGYAREEFLGKELWELGPFKDIAASEIAFRELQSKGYIRYEDLPLETRDGRRIDVEFVSNVYLVDHKQVIQCNIRDITERKRAEAALRESEQRFRALVESTSDWVWAIDQNGYYTYASPKVRDLLGYEPEEVLGKKPFDFMPRDEIDRISGIFNDIVSSHGSFAGLENINLHKDGRRVVLETNGVPIFDVQGNLLGYRGIDRDITERKRVEEAEREQRALAEALRDTAAALSSTLEFDKVLDRILANVGRVVPHNAANITLIDERGETRVARARGYAEQTLEKILSLRLLVASTSNLRRMAETAQPVIMPDTHADPAWIKMEELMWVRSYAGMPIRLKGQVVGFLNLDCATPGFFTPAHTDRLRAFADQAAIAIENARLYNEASRHAEELEQQATELQARNEELDAFAHTVAHDLRNPVGLIMGHAEMLAQDYATISDDQRQRSLQTIVRGGRKMRSIIEALLLLAEVRKTQVERVPLDMASVVAEALQRLAGMVEQYQAEVILPSAWPVALGYAPWVEEVWVNYISNAVKYGGRSPRIELGATAQDNGTVRSWVRDNGAGLTVEEQARLFAPFTRLDQVHVKGYGLGLSIVRRIAEKLGGQVGVESQMGQGSVFSFTLPGVPV